MRFILVIIMLVGIAQAQVENKIPKYIFNNQLAVGTTGDISSSAYLQIGPSSDGNKGILLPRVANTSSIVGTLSKGLFVYDVSKDSIGYYDGSKWLYLGASSLSAPLGSTHIDTTGSYSIPDSVNNVILQYAGGTSITLPDPEAYDKREITIRNVSGNGATFNYELVYSAGNSSDELETNKWVRIKSDGTDWIVVQESGEGTTIIGGGVLIDNF